MVIQEHVWETGLRSQSVTETPRAWRSTNTEGVMIVSVRIKPHVKIQDIWLIQHPNPIAFCGFAEHHKQLTMVPGSPWWIHLRTSFYSAVLSPSSESYCNSQLFLILPSWEKLLFQALEMSSSVSTQATGGEWSALQRIEAFHKEVSSQSIPSTKQQQPILSPLPRQSTAYTLWEMCSFSSIEQKVVNKRR